MLKSRLILASGSPRRLDLLAQAGITPDKLLPMDLDETPKRAEHPRSLARRLAHEKAEAAFQHVRSDPKWAGSYILAADTVVAVGRRILGKPEYVEEASSALHLLSGRSHWVYTGICLITPQGTSRLKVVETKVRFKRLSTMKSSRAISPPANGAARPAAMASRALPARSYKSFRAPIQPSSACRWHETVQLLNGEGYEFHDKWQEG
jgi:septum formation protein